MRAIGRSFPGGVALLCQSHGPGCGSAADAPKLKFEFHLRHPKAPAAGMDNIPDNVLKELGHRMSEEEDLTEQEISCKLTDYYGGDLLSNAMRIYHILGDLSSSPNGRDRDYNHLRGIHSTAQRPPPEEVPRENDYNGDAPIPKETKTFHPVTFHGTVRPPLQATLHVPRASAPAVAPLGVLSDVFANIPKTAKPSTDASFRTSDALPPIPDQSGPNMMLSAIAYNMDRLSNPDVSAKPWALESMDRNGEIWVFCVTVFNNYHVSMCPGVAGKQLAIGLKSLNDRIRPLCDTLEVAFGFTNRFCVGAAALAPGDHEHIWRVRYFTSWTPNQFDFYHAPCEWTLEARTRASAQIETCGINAINMSKMFDAVYGREH